VIQDRYTSKGIPYSLKTANTWRKWWLPLSLVTVCALLEFGRPATLAWLRFESQMIRDGQIWRLVSAHLVHLSWRHCLMNAIALLAICGLYAPVLTPTRLAWWTTASACSVGLGLLWFDPELGWYVGLSGVLHGLLFAGALHDVLSRRAVAAGVLVLAAVGVKLIWEQIWGPLPGSEAASGGKVIVNAHLYGAVGGTLAAVAQSTFAHRLARARGANARNK
jgi:rhomboid family GlyGly-CTERM serine protease